MEFQRYCDKQSCNPLGASEERSADSAGFLARSGNLESVATVDLAKQLVDDLYQITITCAAQRQLAQQGPR